MQRPDPTIGPTTATPVPEVQYEPVADLVRRRVVAVAASYAGALPVTSETAGSLLTTAAQQTGRWHRHGLALQLVIALPASEVADPQTAAMLCLTLEDAGLTPHDLVVEVAETGLVADPSALAAGMRQIAALGVDVCVRDFGTGDSSLVLLRRLPLAALKADAEIVARLSRDPDAGAVLASIARIAEAVGARCDAAGVETAAQHRAVLAMGCVRAQGSAIAPAAPAAGLPAAVDACERALAVSQLTGAAPRRRAQPERAVLVQMQQLHSTGASMSTIAAALNRGGGQHPDGIRWHPTSVARCLATAARAAASSASLAD